MSTMSKTKNGATQHEHSGHHAVEFFSKAGSLFTKRKQFYGNECSVLDLFKDVWRSGNHEVAMKLLFWLRDPRSGAGNRSGFRECMAWLAQEAPEWVKVNAIQIPKYGRYDDLKSLYSNPTTAYVAATIWANDILTENVLAAKWATIEDKYLLKALKKANKSKFKDIGDVRRYIAKIRKDVVEVAMTNKNYENINYSHVPSVAMARYTKAFNRNDGVRFISYKSKLEKAIETGSNEVKVNAGALFPHDCIRTLREGDAAIADAQFASLPNFMVDSGARIMPIADTSGSMSVAISGRIQAIDVSLALAFYCSDRLGKDNPFYKKFLEFSCESNLIDWSAYSKLSDVYKARLVKNAVGSTDVVKALNTILSYGKMFNATKEQMPNYLVIISDMQFNGGATSNSHNTSLVSSELNKWVAAGYDKPTIIYWNTAGNSGSPEKATNSNVALVSGFSPSILKAIFSNPDSMTPYNIMLNAIKDYEIIIPQ